MRNESQIIKKWREEYFVDNYVLTEIKVGIRRGLKPTKNIDIVVLPEFPFDSEADMWERAKNEVNGIDFNKQDKYFRDSGAKMQFILENMDRDEIAVRIFEAKYKLNLKSIGQVLTYSEFFPDFYSGTNNIKIAEKGLIYHEEDPLIREMARRSDISLYEID